MNTTSKVFGKGFRSRSESIAEAAVELMKGRSIASAPAILMALVLAGCSGGGDVVTSGEPQGTNCTGSCTTAASFLSVADVQQVIAQGVAEAQARNVNATIAVTDRVGNVLAVYRMGDPATRSMQISTQNDANGNPVIDGGLEGIKLPLTTPPFDGVNLDQLGAIAKAVTGAYLSSEGNAFSTRSANQIVQENFNPGETDQPSGPLFGVQFSQLACSDFSQRDEASVGPGPHRSPLGLSADPGGLPLYRDGAVIGAVGVISDGLYSIDKNIRVNDANTDDEAIAIAATLNFSAPDARRGDNITVAGKTFRYSDVQVGEIISRGNVPPFSSITSSVGRLIAVPGYIMDADGPNGSPIRAGTAFGQPASGIRSDGGENFDPMLDAFVFVDANNGLRYPPKAATDAALTGSAAMTQADVRQIMSSALNVANTARAQIRQPASTPVRVTISVVDTNGEILGMVRTRDAPVFGADVSLQKARTANFLSTSTAGQFLTTLPNTEYLIIKDGALAPGRQITLGNYVTDMQAFFADPSMLMDGRIAFSERAMGNFTRPFFPDGSAGKVNGPLSKPAGEWSVFSSGVQLDLAINAVLQHVVFSVSGGGLGIPDVDVGCAGVMPFSMGFGSTLPGNVRLGNGMQIFPGGVPIYRGEVHVGAIGISGDGIDQDDMVAFLGLSRAGEILKNGIDNAPKGRRADNLKPQGTSLRYVQCPQDPFIKGDEQNVCQGR